MTGHTGLFSVCIFIFAFIGLECYFKQGFVDNTFHETELHNCFSKFGTVIHRLKSFSTVSAGHCAVLCHQYDNCFKFLTCKGERNKNCYIIQKTGIPNDIMDGCSCFSKADVTCENGGVLKNWGCDCIQGFYGDKCELIYKDCDEAARHGLTGTNPVVIKPNGASFYYPVLCEIIGNDTFTYIQKRQISTLDFARTWHWYKKGFGGLGKSFWLGLRELVSQSTNSTMLEITLRFDMSDSGSFRLHTARFANFSIGPESDDYRINVDGFSSESNLGDFLRRALNPMNGQRFSTADHDSTVAACPARSNSGWWFGSECQNGNLNFPISEYTVDHKPKVQSAVTWYIRNKVVRITETYMKIKFAQYF